MRVGMLAEIHPDLDHREICQLLIEAEHRGGLNLHTAFSVHVPDEKTLSQGSA